MDQALGIAVAVAPDLGVSAFTSDKGVVLGHAAIVANADNGTQHAGQVLGFLAVLGAVAHRDQQGFVLQKHQPRAKVSAGILIGPGAEDLLDIAQLVVDKACFHHPSAVGFGRSARICQVHQAILGKARVWHHIGQGALAAAVDIGQLRHRLLDQGAVANQPQGAGFFCHQHVAIGQKGKAVGAVETLHQGFNPVVFLLCMYNWRQNKSHSQYAANYLAKAQYLAKAHLDFSRLISANTRPPAAPASIWQARPAGPRVPA